MRSDITTGPALPPSLDAASFLSGAALVCVPLAVGTAEVVHGRRGGGSALYLAFLILATAAQIFVTGALWMQVGHPKHVAGPESPNEVIGIAALPGMAVVLCIRVLMQEGRDYNGSRYRLLFVASAAAAIVWCVVLIVALRTTCRKRSPEEVPLLGFS